MNKFCVLKLQLTFESIIKIFASMEPSPLLDELEACCTAVLKGFRANPINFPGTTFHRALLVSRPTNFLISP